MQFRHPPQGQTAQDRCRRFGKSRVFCCWLIQAVLVLICHFKLKSSSSILSIWSTWSIKCLFVSNKVLLPTTFQKKRGCCKYLILQQPRRIYLAGTETAAPLRSVQSVPGPAWMMLVFTFGLRVLTKIICESREPSPTAFAFMISPRAFSFSTFRLPFHSQALLRASFYIAELTYRLNQAFF